MFFSSHPYPSLLTITASVVDLVIPRHTGGWKIVSLGVAQWRVIDFVDLGILARLNSSPTPTVWVIFSEEEDICRCCCSEGIDRKYYAGAMAPVAYSGDDEDGYGDGHSEYGDDDDDDDDVVDGGGS